MISLQFLLTALVVVLAPGSGVIYMAMTLAVFILYGVFAAAARSRVLGSDTVMRWLNRSFAAIFAALAGRLALERA